LKIKKYLKKPHFVKYLGFIRKLSHAKEEAIVSKKLPPQTYIKLTLRAKNEKEP
jgi:hypothetical protein